MQVRVFERYKIKKFRNITIYYACEGGIDKYDPTTVLHHEVCHVMANRDREVRIFLAHPHTKNRLFFVLTIIYCIFRHYKRFPEVPEYARMRHNTVVSLT